MKDHYGSHDDNIWNFNTPSFDLDLFNKKYVNEVNMLVWILSEKLKAKARLVNGQACMMYIFYLDLMIGLLCQSKIYLNIMLEINKMAQDGYVERNGVAMIPPQGKRKGGLWGN